MLQIIKYVFIKNFDLKKIENYIILFEIEMLDDIKLLKNEIDDMKKIILENDFKKTGALIKVKNINNDTITFIKNLKNTFDYIFGYGGLNKINRFFIETKKIDFLVDPHNSFFKTKFDFLHHFNSGLNHILCNIARQKETKFITTLNFTKDYKTITFQKNVGRINQNLKLFKRYKLQNHFCYFCETEKDIVDDKRLREILNLFNLENKFSKTNSFDFEKSLEKIDFEKSEDFVYEGIEIIK